jgi:replicative DNA helicase
MKPIRSLENERCVLGAMLRDQHELYRVSYLLTGEMFAGKNLFSFSDRASPPRFDRIL